MRSVERYGMKILDIKDLPSIISLLPIQGAVLFPRGHLPLPIMTPKHFSLVAEVWNTHRYVGVVQLNPDDSSDPTSPNLFSSGTLGRVSEINEFDDGRLFANITGVCRFDVIKEIKGEGEVRHAVVSYDSYAGDLVTDVDFAFDRSKLLKELDAYFKRHDIDANWEEIRTVPNEKLITALAIACPFTNGERQAILQCASIKEQSQLITSLIEMANREPNTANITRH